MPRVGGAADLPTEGEGKGKGERAKPLWGRAAVAHVGYCVFVCLCVCVFCVLCFGRERPLLATNDT